MRPIRLIYPAVFCIALIAGNSASASAEDWQKSYSVNGRAQLIIAAGDARLDLHSCGDCRSIKIDVDWKDRNPSDFILKESQSGDMVNFSLQEKAQIGIHFTVHNWHAPQVTVETPATLDIQAKMSDGPVKIAGISGNLDLHTSDGAVDLDDVNGAVRLTASDGSVKLHNLTGTLDSHTSDGRAVIDGKFSSLQIKIGDGNLDVTVAEGSKLTAPSRIEASDGRVQVKLPRTLAADLDVHVGDGKLNSSLPVMVNGYNSGHDSGHNLRGQLNGGGATLTIHTGDGNLTLGSL